MCDVGGEGEWTHTRERASTRLESAEGRALRASILHIRMFVVYLRSMFFVSLQRLNLD